MNEIEEGYRQREEVVQGALLRQLLDPTNESEIDRLNLLAAMISEGKCDIRIAMMQENRALYHEKIGIIEDDEGNRVAFQGSLNETRSALYGNFESIDLFFSWSGESDAVRVQDKVDAFDRLWSNRWTKVKTFKFTELESAIVKKYLRPERELVDVDLKEGKSAEPIEVNEGPKPPAWLKLYPYQKLAVENFMSAKGRGIFDMATGTGKTLTALSAMTVLSASLGHVLGVVIVVPYKHLVAQWLEDIEAFGIDNPIACYSDSKQNWTISLKFALRSLRLRREDSFFCCITTTATFASEKFQQIITSANTRPLLLIADEAHNLGAGKTRGALTPVFDYRLALSATLERHHDAEGTSVLRNYFGDSCIEYGLGRAIEEGFLTPYEYYPIFVTMSSEERDAYGELTKKIGRALNAGSSELTESAKRLLIDRARLIANIKAKIPALCKALEPFKHESNILIYCGASVSFSTDVGALPDDYGEEAQIDEVVREASNMGMKVSTFTSQKNGHQREQLKMMFAQGAIQALVAIKCLDEGVSISGIQKAFILASSTNPKEYIQRRGRVLRLAKGKKKAEIYDFIVLPFSMEDTKSKLIKELEPYRRLVANELSRYREFSTLSRNIVFNNAEFLKLCTAYQLDISLPNLMKGIF